MSWRQGGSITHQLQNCRIKKVEKGGESKGTLYVEELEEIKRCYCIRKSSVLWWCGGTTSEIKKNEIRAHFHFQIKSCILSQLLSPSPSQSSCNIDSHTRHSSRQAPNIPLIAVSSTHISFAFSLNGSNPFLLATKASSRTIISTIMNPPKHTKS